MTQLATAPSDLITEIGQGRVPWERVRDFPQEDEADRERTDAAIRLLDAAPPSADLESFRAQGFTRSQLKPEEGGLGLSDFGMFRTCVAAMHRNLPTGLVLATHNGIGLPALLPALPPGPQRDLVLKRLAEGSLTGWADTEPIGAANQLPATRAERCSGGFRLTGEKVFISNATIAGDLIVSAVVAGETGACLFLVDTRAPGFSVRAAQEVIGLRGLPLGALSFDGVVVPHERALVGAGEHWRDAGLLEPLSSRGRTYLVSGAALAIAEQAAACGRDFVRRRSVDGRPLASYPAIRSRLAGMAAEIHTVDSVVRWCLPGDDLAARHRDRLIVKNVTTLACWRVVDATASLLGAEGVETADSKRSRGAPALPVEQLLRDARCLRIMGGVDFAVDLWAGERLLGGPSPVADGEDCDPAGLSPRNARHLAALSVRTRRFGAACARLRRRYPDLPSRQRQVIAAGHIARELFTATVLLGRAVSAPAIDQHLASVACAAAFARASAAWPDLAGTTTVRDGEDDALAAWCLGEGR